MNSPLYLHHLCVEFYSAKIKEAHRRANAGNSPLDRYHDQGARDYFSYLENAINETYEEVKSLNPPDIAFFTAATFNAFQNFTSNRSRTIEYTELFLASAKDWMQKEIEQQQSRGVKHGSYGMQQPVAGMEFE